jgi:uncharacterized protein with HEPN domain
MAPRSPRAWLVDIRTEIAGIQDLTKNADLATFAASWAMKRAVQHALLIIAEAAKHLPPAMKKTQPQVPWERIHGLGNILRHEYRRVDPEILWSLITDRLADLDKAAAELLQNFPK